MKNIILLLLLLISVSACQEVVELDLDNGKRRIVVDGLVTDSTGYNYIKLSFTADYFSSEMPETIQNAIVSVSDNMGNSYPFLHTENGIYSNSGFTGIPGTNYTLQIQHGGKTFTGSSQLLPVSEVDSLTYAYIEKTAFQKAGYHVFLFAKEPKNEANFYRFQVYENDSLYNGAFDLFVRSDEIVDEYIMAADMGYIFDKGDTVTVEMQSLNRPTYEYYVNLINILTNDGGLFSSPPVNPPTNMSEGAIGVFRASSTSAKTIIIK